MVAVPREVHLTCSMRNGQDICGQYLLDIYMYVGVVVSYLHFEGD